MSVSVEHAQFLLATPTTISEAVAGVTKADLQPAGQDVATPRNVAVDSTAFTFVSNAIGLTWTQDTLTISVTAAAPTILPYDVEGRRGTPVLTAYPTILGSEILFQLSSGDWTVPVDVGVPTILGQDLVLEKNQNFDRGAPVFSPSAIPLSIGAVIAYASPTIAGQTITLTWGQGIAGVESTALSIQGQTITLNKSWSLAVDSTALDVDGQNITFDWTVPATVVVESTQFSAVGGSFQFRRDMPVETTAISPTGQSIGRGDGTIVSPAFIELTPYDIGLSFPFTLGTVLEHTEPYLVGSEITLFLGDGQPRQFRYDLTSDHIQISLSSPEMAKAQRLPRMTSGTS